MERKEGATLFSFYKPSWKRGLRQDPLGVKTGLAPCRGHGLQGLTNIFRHHRVPAEERGGDGAKAGRKPTAKYDASGAKIKGKLVATDRKLAERLDLQKMEKRPAEEGPRTSTSRMREFSPGLVGKNQRRRLGLNPTHSDQTKNNTFPCPSKQVRAVGFLSRKNDFCIR